MPARERRRVWKYLGKTEGPVRDIASELIRLAWSSRAALALAPLQDLLNLGPEGRMNVPGQVKGNWRWRATEHMLAGDHFRWLKELTERSNRATVVTLPTMETTA
jgi:4-alpha-glucanotransferase